MKCFKIEIEGLGVETVHVRNINTDIKRGQRAAILRDGIRREIQCVATTADNENTCFCGCFTFRQAMPDGTLGKMAYVATESEIIELL